MAKFHPDEIELCRLIFQDPECATHAVTASISGSVGVVLSQSGRPVGRWRKTGDRLCYFGIIATEPLVVAASLQAALGATRAMATTKHWNQPWPGSTDPGSE